jgi:hypothetical protein
MFLSRFNCFYGSTLYKDWLTNHITEIKYFWKRIRICMAVLCLKSNYSMGITRFLEKIGNCMAVLCLKSNQSIGIIHFLEKIEQLYGSTESKDLPTNQIIGIKYCLKKIILLYDYCI